MRYFSTRLLSLIAFCIMTTTFASFANEQEDVIIGLDNVFVPKGFDSNDNVEIVVSGELPNTCYLRPHGEVKIVDDLVVVEMKATKITDPNTVCINAIVPYVTAVHLGRLPQKTYSIYVNAGTASEKTGAIKIEQANSHSINNFSYANVTAAEASLNKSEFTISGVHPSSCMEIERVEVIVNESNDTFSVLPIIKQAQPICDRMIKPFTYKIQLPEAQKSQRLVHIRKLDGTALNYIVNGSSKGHR